MCFHVWLLPRCCLDAIIHFHKLLWGCIAKYYVGAGQRHANQRLLSKYLHAANLFLLRCTWVLDCPRLRSNDIWSIPKGRFLAWKLQDQTQNSRYDVPRSATYPLLMTANLSFARMRSRDTMTAIGPCACAI